MTAMDAAAPVRYVTLAGLPLLIELTWPFHPSTSGADWFSLHGRVSLDDDSGLHADVAVNLTQVIKEALPSLAPEHAETAVVNAIRKDLDGKQLELLRSGKRQPVPVSSRHYDFKAKKLIFARASEDEIYRFLRRKTYWLDVRAGAARVGDAIDMDYLNATPQQMHAAAQRLAAEGFAVEQGGSLVAQDKLRALATEFENEKGDALSALVAKHAYERG
jgi:hypothetical protein